MFEWPVLGKKAKVLYNVFNGCFMLMRNKAGGVITESSVTFEGQKWYDDLLDFLYYPAPVKEKV